MSLKQWVRKWLLWEVTVKLNTIMKGLQEMSAAFDLMLSKVTELKTVNDSVLALIDKLVASLGGATTMAEVEQIVAELGAEKDRLAAAVVANTPVE